MCTTKKCSDVSSQVSLGKFRADIIGGKFRIGPRNEDSKFGHLIETELHLVEIKKNLNEIRAGFGQILLYKQLMRKLCWSDHLYLYLAVERDYDEENELSEEHFEFLKHQGIGLLSIKGAKLEVKIEPLEQTRSLLANIRNKSILECHGCSSDYKLQEIECKRCGQLLRFNIYGDLFKNTSLKLTNEITESIRSDPVLRSVFKDPDNSAIKLHKTISSNVAADMNK
ncbi:hypothetical protein J4421_00715 [Candidatus Woesearchaeota archaeon]|nr:hypothetical protein [Candidatus Woesearchaeota archaeon]